MKLLKINLTTAIEEIKKRKAKKIILQLPEGLKTKLVSVSQELEQKTNAEIITSISPIFGACDLAIEELQKFDADLIVHIGHNEFFKFNKAIYVPLYYNIPKKSITITAKKLEKVLKQNKFKKIAIAGVVQYKKALLELKKLLEKKGFIVLIEKGKRTTEGQVLGCGAGAINKISKKADCAVFVGDGMFHAQAINFSTNKKSFKADLLNEKITELKETDLFLRQRFALIQKAKKAKKFGIIITTKPGQMRYGNALRLKKIIEKKGKTAILLTGNLILPEFLLGINVDCFVSTACPRISIDDWKNFKKPIINPIELEILLDEKKWSEFKFEEY